MNGQSPNATAGVMPGPERDGVKNMLYLQLGQLSQLLRSIKDELSALEEAGRQRDRWKKGAVIMAIKGSNKWFSVKQKTATSLTHSFTVTLSRFTDVKVLFPSSAVIILICVFICSKKLHTHACTHT